MTIRLLTILVIVLIFVNSGLYLYGISTQSTKITKTVTEKSNTTVNEWLTFSGDEDFYFSIDYPKRLNDSDYDWVVEKQSVSVSFSEPNIEPAGPLSVNFKSDAKQKLLRSFKVFAQIDREIDGYDEPRPVAQQRNDKMLESHKKNVGHTLNLDDIAIVTSEITLESGASGTLVISTSHKMDGPTWISRKVFLVQGKCNAELSNGVDNAFASLDIRRGKATNISQDLPEVFEHFYKSFRFAPACK